MINYRSTYKHYNYALRNFIFTAIVLASTGVITLLMLSLASNIASGFQ